MHEDCEFQSFSCLRATYRSANACKSWTTNIVAMPVPMATAMCNIAVTFRSEEPGDSVRRRSSVLLPDRRTQGMAGAAGEESGSSLSFPRQGPRVATWHHSCFSRILASCGLLAAMIGAVSAGVVSRSVESQAVADFLLSASVQPSGLIIEGEAGIGKTTLWSAGLEHAQEQGFRVLCARVGQAESVLAYAAVADLLRDVESTVLAKLPDLQRIALDRVLLRADGEGPATDQRVVAAAFLSVVEHLAADTPVLAAIDDVQWLDPSSKAVVTFAARRLKGRVGVLIAERSDPGTGTVASWLQLATTDRIARIRLQPLSMGGLQRLISERLGRVLPRPTMVRIAEISGGNPFYALELARAMDAQSPSAEPVLPATLTELVRTRIGRLDDDVRDMLLAAACVADATVELLAQATGTGVERTVELLEGVESNGIVAIDGNRVRFSHPLLARGVYTEASPARRRHMHRALADVIPLPELKARHLALGTANEDPSILQALDAAAEAARARGAPAAAAELVDLAIGLGGDSPSRRIRSAAHHFEAGETAQARAMLEPAMERLQPGTLRALALNLAAGMHVYDNRFTEADDLLKRALDDAKDNPVIQVPNLVMLSFVAQATARGFDESLRYARQAVSLAEELGVPALLSQALAWWVNVSFLYGPGLDESGLRRSLDLEDHDIDVPISFRASVIYGLILAWTGRLEEGNTWMLAVRHRCIERGAERDLSSIAGFSALIDIWRGRFNEAGQNAEHAVELAEQLGGEHILIIPLTIRSKVNAYAGREREARADARAAIDRAQWFRLPRMAEWPTMTLGFLEVSRGNYAEALALLQPLLSTLDQIPATEIMTSWYIPDAAEALVAVGRLDDAERLIGALERNGAQRDRSWMLATGARCRGMLLAARGDVAAAELMARQAMTEHERLPMPFERARTQLLLGQLQRRQRRKESAAATLSEALHAFEDMGTPLWAERARAELARTNVGPSRHLALTPSEQRVAELAASGMTNRDIGATLFISPKTVEHNLSRIYRKLGIRGRAELGRRMDQCGGSGDSINQEIE